MFEISEDISDACLTPPISQINILSSKQGLPMLCAENGITDMTQPSLSLVSLILIICWKGEGFSHKKNAHK